VTLCRSGTQEIWTNTAISTLRALSRFMEATRLSHQCHCTHWMKYDAVSWDAKRCRYRPRHRYFVDDHPALACTTLDEAVYLTYFHAHFGKGHCCTPQAATVVDKRMMYSEWVEQAEKGRLMLDVEVFKHEI